MEDANPSPNYNPSTPGYQHTPFQPQTPGSSHMYGSDSYSPYQTSSSPSPSPYTSGYMGTPSPTGYSPAAGPASPYNPQTPGASLDSQINDWCTTDIVVKIKTNEDSDLSGQQGIIRTVNSGVCSVFLIEEDRVVTVQSSNLEPIPPRAKDMFKVLSGDQRDQMGQVVSIAGREAIVRLNNSNEPSMLPLQSLCKLKLE